MMKFRLLAGRHHHKGRTYVPGEIVESNLDLAKKLGRDKFQHLSGQPDKNYETDTPLVGESAAAPGGQVSSGFQATTSLPDGSTISGPEDKLVAGRGFEDQPKPIQPHPKEGDDVTSTPGVHPKAKHTLPNNLDHMSVAQLKDFAEAEEIDLRGSTNKTDMLKTIRAARSDKK